MFGNIDLTVSVVLQREKEEEGKEEEKEECTGAGNVETNARESHVRGNGIPPVKDLTCRY